MFLIYIFSTSISATKLQIRWKRERNLEVTVSFRASFSTAGRQVIIGGTSCNLPTSALSYEGAISWLNKSEKEFLTYNNYPDINDEQWINEFVIWLRIEWFLHQLIMMRYSYWNQVNMIKLCVDAQSMLHDEWCMLGWNKN